MRIGIAIGDPTGIGPEVALKAVAAESERDASVEYCLIGDEAWLGRHPYCLESRRTIEFEKQRRDPGSVTVVNPTGETVPGDIEQGSKEAGRLALSWVEAGARECLEGHVDALVTAPVNKAAIVESEPDFVGQTEWLTRLANTERTAMMLLGEAEPGRWLRVALVTTHLPLRRVADAISTSKVADVIELAVDACQRLGCTRRRIGVCGLNPHAGEGGALGNEEAAIIEPAVRAMREKGHDIEGPLSADTLFYHAYHGTYDAVVAMYHDQGLAPLKMVAFDSGVNWTLGLPFVRTSPDHGTAYALAGRNEADPSSMRAAIRLAAFLAAGEGRGK